MDAWVYYSLSLTVVYAIMVLLLEFVLKRNNTTWHFPLALMATSGLVALGILLLAHFVDPVNSRWSAESLRAHCTWSTACLVMVIAALTVTANILYMNALKNAPNSGYATGVINSYMLLVVIGSCLLFGSKLNGIKVLGISFVLLGTSLLVFK